MKNETRFLTQQARTRGVARLTLLAGALTLALALVLALTGPSSAPATEFTVDSLKPFTPQTELVTINRAGTDASGGLVGGRDYAISESGRFVAFTSYASDLVTNDTNGGAELQYRQDVFIRDLQTETTTLVSVNWLGTDSGNNISNNPALSADGRFVAFTSIASDLVANDTNGRNDVFVRDLKTGTTTLVSINRAETGSGNSDSIGPKLSADGRFVAFTSYASDLAPIDTPGGTDIGNVFVRDLKTGTTTLASVNRTGTSAGNDLGGSSNGVLSADGRFVAFQSFASDLVANDTNGAPDIFVRDLRTGTTTLASVNHAGTDSGTTTPIMANHGILLWGLEGPVFSPDGRFVAFTSRATDLVANDTNGTGDVFVRDLKTGTTTLASINRAGTNSGNGDSSSSFPSLSAHGRFVAFQSSASDLVETDTNGTLDVFVRDLKTGTTTLASANRTGTSGGNDYSILPSLSSDGRFVAFQSLASDLVATDTNGGFERPLPDVFVRDLKTGSTALVSVNRTGTDSGNSGSSSPVLSADGRLVVFASGASDLVVTDTNRIFDLFVRPVP